MSWRDSIKEEKGGSWKDTIKEEAPEVSQTESGLRGLAQGASMGFADELTGGAEALWEAAKGDPRTFGELYKAKRDESRANYETAEKANPKTYMAGQVGGAIGTALVPGLGQAGIGKLALQGAAQGLGSSEADLTEGDVSGALRDTAIGGAIGAATGVAGKGLQKLLPSTQKVAGSVIDAAEDMSNPLAQLSGNSYQTVPGKMFGASNKTAQIANAIGDIPENIGAGLRESGAAIKAGDPMSALTGVLRSAKSGIGGDALEAAFTAGAPKTVNQVAKPLGQRAADMAIGSTVMGSTTGGTGLGIAAGAKALGKGLDAVNKGIYNQANNLSLETVQSLAPKLGKYGTVLMNAAQRGEQGLAATHFVLQQTDPEYRTKMREATDGSADESIEE